MRRVLLTAFASVVFALTTTPASAASAPAPTPANDPCSFAAITGAIACQGYYDGNLITGGLNSATTPQEQTYINLLLTGTPATNDVFPTTNGGTYTGSYSSIDYSKVLGAIENLNGSATLNFGSLNLTGLTIVGAHFGNSLDSNANNVTAFWLVDLGNTVTHSLTLKDGAGSSNAQIFATGVQGAVPEPATWAMMMLGFGAMGASIRRSRRRSGKMLQIA